MTNRKRTNNDTQNTAQKTKDPATRPSLISGDELGCSGTVISACSTCGIFCVTLVTDPVISFERGNDRIAILTNGTHPRSFVRGISHQLYFCIFCLSCTYVCIAASKCTYIAANFHHRGKHFILSLKKSLWKHMIIYW